VLGRRQPSKRSCHPDLWGARGALADKPTLLVWGMQDPAIGPAHLARWEQALSNAQTVRLEGAGYFPQEEASFAMERAVADALLGASSLQAA